MRRESTGSWVWASVIPWGLVACDCGWAGLAAPLGRGRPRFSAVSPPPPAAICYTSPRMLVWHPPPNGEHAVASSVLYTGGTQALGVGAQGTETHHKYLRPEKLFMDSLAGKARGEQPVGPSLLAGLDTVLGAGDPP